MFRETMYNRKKIILGTYSAFLDKNLFIVIFYGHPYFIWKAVSNQLYNTVLYLA